MIIRSLWRAISIKENQSPYNKMHLKVLYPGKLTQSDREKNTGKIEFDRSLAPLPVVILFGGVNCSQEIYHWLAFYLASQNLITVTFNLVVGNPSVFTGLTPGIDVEALKSNKYGSVPTNTSLPYILEELKKLNSEGLLKDGINLNKVVVGGHSAGGRSALESANPNWFSGISASFGYGIHSAGALQGGYETGTILPLPSFVPTLIMGGTKDGIIAQSSQRYGLKQWETPATPVIRTFNEAISSTRNDAYLVILEGANHLSIGDRTDSTTGRSFLDFAPTYPQEQYRKLISEILINFINAYIRKSQEALEKLNLLLNTNNQLVAKVDRK